MNNTVLIIMMVGLFIAGGLFGESRLINHNIDKHINVGWVTPDVQKATNSLYEISAEILYKEDDSVEIKTTTGLSIGIPINDNYIIALTHATNFKPIIKTYIPFFGAVETHRTLVSPPKFYMKNKQFNKWDEIELIGRFEDISLFRSLTEKILPFPFPFGDINDLIPGMPLLSIGYSYGKLINLKDGIASNVKDSFSDKIDYSTFLFSNPSNPGDSGSPVLGYDSDRNLVIFGITQKSYKGQGLSFALRSDYVLDTIAKIKNISKLKNDFKKVRIK